MHCYPCIDDPVTIQKESGVWADFGTPTEVIPANTIETRFNINLLSISNISATGNFQIRLYFGPAGSEREFMTVPFSGTIALMTSAEIKDGERIIAENTRISAALTGSNNGTNTIGLTLGFECIPEIC
jgi:hypothetical protein